MKDKIFLKYLPSLAFVLMVYSYFPQLILTYTTKNVEGQSIQFWIALSVSLLIMAAQQARIFFNNKKVSPVGMIFQFVNFLLAFMMLVGVIIFR